MDEYLAELEGPLLDEDGMPDEEYLRLNSEEKDVTVLDYHFSLFLGVVCILYGYVVDKMLLLYTLVVLSKCYSFFF